MEISDHPSGLRLSGPFSLNDAPDLIEAMQDRDSLYVSDLSVQEGDALADLLVEGLQPWLEETNRHIRLFIIPRAGAVPFERLAQASRIQPVYADYTES